MYITVFRNITYLSITAQSTSCGGKLYEAGEMISNTNSNSQEKQKKTDMLTKEANISKTINIYFAFYQLLKKTLNCIK